MNSTDSAPSTPSAVPLAGHSTPGLLTVSSHPRVRSTPAGRQPGYTLWSVNVARVGLEWTDPGRTRRCFVYPRAPVHRTDSGRTRRGFVYPRAPVHQGAAASAPVNETCCSENRGSGESSSRGASPKLAFQITRP